jgi:predicted DNA-binding transcriptional regulator YafY
MRASRLLQMLLLLQNRGRMTCQRLARELEVTRRTVLRDVDALTEAGLPIIVLRGREGGVELGFNYRTRLTGLAADEAEALALLLYQKTPALDQLAMRPAATRAVAKLVESLPDAVRAVVETAREQVKLASAAALTSDPRVEAIAGAIRQTQLIHVRAQTASSRVMHPAGLELTQDGWVIHDARKDEPSIRLAEAGNVNISARKF